LLARVIALGSLAKVALEVAIQKAMAVPVGAAWLRGVLRSTAALPEVQTRLSLRTGGAGIATCSLRVTGDRELRRLNRSFLGEDRVTDVLAFPGGSAEYLGDIAVSWPAARRQAVEFGHAAEVELAFLSVHGLLHLAGLDHMVASEAREMERLGLAALRSAGLPAIRGRLRA
jgi:rRNA maturation RNase YbeY